MFVTPTAGSIFTKTSIFPLLYRYDIPNVRNIFHIFSQETLISSAVSTGLVNFAEKHKELHIADCSAVNVDHINVYFRTRSLKHIQLIHIRLWQRPFLECTYCMDRIKRLMRTKTAGISTPAYCIFIRYCELSSITVGWQLPIKVSHQNIRCTNGNKQPKYDVYQSAIFSHICIIRFLADWGRHGLRPPAFSEHWLSCTGCWQY